MPLGMTVNVTSKMAALVTVNMGVLGTFVGYTASLKDVVGLAQVKPHVARVSGTPLRVGIVGVLVAIEADRVGPATDLDARALTLAIARRRDLDVVTAERRADEARAAAVEVAEVPVQAAEISRSHGVFVLKHARDARLADLDAGADSVRDPVEVQNAVAPDDPWLVALVNASVRSKIASGRVGLDDSHINTAVVVDVETGVGAGSEGGERKDVVLEASHRGCNWYVLGCETLGIVEPANQMQNFSGLNRKLLKECVGTCPVVNDCVKCVAFRPRHLKQRSPGDRDASIFINAWCLM
jgi:hypothetical protein